MRISDWSSDVCSSDLMALSLTPALCATFLKPHLPEDQRKRGWFMDRFGRLFGRFNIWFDRTTGRYQGVVGRLLSAPLSWLAVFAAMLVITLFLFTRIPGGFLPIEDQGTVLTAVQAPPGDTRERTEAAVAQVKAFYRKPSGRG